MNPVVLTVTAGCPVASSQPLSLDHLHIVALWRGPPDEEHFVADDDHGRHRVRLVGTTRAPPFALSLPLDTSAPLRLDAAARLAHLPVSSPTYRPTHLQRARLTLLLNILDALAGGLPKRAIASLLVYPHMTPLHGAAWKASAERRRTHRLCQEAARLRDRGVRDLLLGRLRPRG